MCATYVSVSAATCDSTASCCSSNLSETEVPDYNGAELMPDRWVLLDGLVLDLARLAATADGWFLSLY